jgi:hypothetical protein
VQLKKVGDRWIIENNEPYVYQSDEIQYFVVMSEEEDYLTCVNFGFSNTVQYYDADLGDVLQAAGLTGTVVYVAKPYWLQQTPFQGKTVFLNGSNVLLKYTAIGTKMENIKQFVRPKDGAPKSSTKTKFDVNYGKNAPLANSMEDEAKAMPGMAASPAPMMSPAPPAPMMAGSALGKALSSRSMFIPRPMGAYDPFGIQRSATQLPVHTASVTEYGTMQQHPSAAYKSCSTHGITYRSDLGCHPCTVSKSRECSQCGIEMHKAMGGVLRCPRGH